jgi:hypothetical protein
VHSTKLREGGRGNKNIARKVVGLSFTVVFASIHPLNEDVPAPVEKQVANLVE